MASTTNVSLAGSLNLGQAIQDLVIVGDVVYAVSLNTTNELLAINVADPTNPYVIAEAALNNSGYAIDIEDGYLHVGAISTASNNEHQIYQLPGVIAPTGYVGDLGAERVRVNDRLTAGNIDVDGGLFVNGPGDFGQSISVDGDATVSGTLSVSQGIGVEEGITLASSSPATTTLALYNLGSTLYWNGSSLPTWAATALPTPGFIAPNDDDTGLGGDGANALWMTTSGTLAVYIASSTNVGFGTSTLNVGSAITINNDQLSFTLDTLTRVTSTAVTNTIRDIEVIDGIAYTVGDNTTGMGIYDVSDPTSPTLLSFYDLPSSNIAYDIDVVDGIAYISMNTAGSAGFSIIDVSDPTTPVGLSTTSLSWVSYELEVQGDYVYVSTWRSGANYNVSVYDVSDKTAPVRVAENETGTAGDIYAMDIYGTDLYIGRTSATGDEIQVWSFATNSIELVNVGGYEATATIYDLTVEGPYAFIGQSNTSQEFAILDVASTTNISVVGSLNLVAAPQDIAIVGDYAYVTLLNTTNEMLVIDISDVTAPRVIAEAELGNTGYAVDVEDGYIHVGATFNASNEEYQIFRAPGINAPTAVIGEASIQNLNVSDRIRAGRADIAGGLFVSGPGDFSGGLSVLNGGIKIASTTVGTTSEHIYNLGGTLYWDGTSLSSPLVFTGSNNDAAYTAGGNVGIGTTTPQANLDVLGTSRVSQNNLTQLMSTGTLDNATVNNIVSYGNIVYVLLNTHVSGQEILVYDMSSSTPLQIGGYELASTAYAGAISGDTLYVASGVTGAELQAFDISVPAEPRLLSTFDLSATPNEIVLSGGVLYAALSNNNSTLQAIDISDPTAMVSLYTTDIGTFLYDVEVRGDNLYTIETSEFSIYDITTSTDLTLRGSYTAPSTIYSVEVFGRYAYIVAAQNTTGELLILDIMSSSTPQLVGSYAAPTTNYWYDLRVAYPYVYTVGINTSGSPDYDAAVIDVTDPYAPVLVAGHDFDGQVNALSINDDRVIYGLTGSGSLDELQVFQSASFLTPVATIGQLRTDRVEVDSSLDVLGNLNAGTLRADRASVSDVLTARGIGIGTTTPGNHLALQNASVLVTPGTPTLTGSYDYTGSDYAQSLHPYGDLLVVISATTNDEIEIFDATDPDSLVLLSSLTAGSSPSDIHIQGRYMFVSGLANGSEDEFRVYDISIPASPVLIGGYDAGTSLYDIEIQGNIAYVGSAVTPEIHIFDITNPYDIELVNRVDADATVTELDVHLNKLYAFSAATGNDLQVYDITTSTEPVEVGSIQLGASIQVGGIEYANGYLYLAGYTNSSTEGITILDVHSSTTPIYAGFADTGTTANSLDIVGEYLFVGENTASNAVKIFSLAASSTNPSLVAQFDGATTVTDVAVANATLYVGSASTGNDIEMYSLAKVEVIAANIGVATVGKLYVEHDLFSTGDAAIGGALFVGDGGIYTSGAIAAFGSTSTFKSIVPVTTSVFALGSATSSWGEGYIDDVYIATSSVANIGNLCRDTTTGQIGVCASLGAYKENVVDLSLGLSEVLALTPREFDWTESYGGFHDFGFVAEEVAAVSPLLAQYSAGDSGDLVSVKYASISALLVNAVKEQQAQIDALAMGGVLQGGVAFSPSSSLTVADLTVTGNLTVGKHARFSGDSVGRARIVAGHREVNVTFEDRYGVIPVITVTPNVALQGGYAVTQKSQTGFTIELTDIQNTAVVFDWHAFGSDKITVTDSGSDAEQEIIVTPAPATPPAPSTPPQDVAGDQVEAEEETEESQAPVVPIETNTSTPPVETVTSTDLVDPLPTDPVVPAPETPSSTLPIDPPQDVPPTEEPSVELPPADPTPVEPPSEPLPEVPEESATPPEDGASIITE